ncbi:glycosyltransferase family 39 protein [Methylibium sp.]|uniref:ArnT family glycosyltransferase n=1 Tax=Methylibium sp. TaxID=2067992 RepID=UPI0017A9C4AE|nr:glycosyltransferase family 39 protein [Methylibium sp.]MBA3588012.1 glycosyltransferase family 39 protein [Methylibium sp.]
MTTQAQRSTFGGNEISLRQLAWVLAAALALRIGWAVLVPVVPLSDSVAYETFARNLVLHGVYGWTPHEPFAFWPPGTSFLYAAVYKLFGFGHFNIVLLNLLISAALIVTSARVAARFFGAQVALFTAAVLAVWPTLVLFTTVLASELPFLLFTMLALDVWTAPRGSVLFRGLLAGVLLGAAALVRPLALALPVVYGAAVLFSSAVPRQVLRSQMQVTVLALAAMACVVSPWTWRNYQLYGAPVLISTNGGITLWMGNSPGTRGDYMPIPERLNHLNDHEQSVVLGDEAKRYILDDPAGFAVRTLRKLIFLYGNESIGVIWNAGGISESFGEPAVLWLKRFTQLSWVLIFLTAAWGAWVLLRRLGWRRFILSPPVVTIAFYSAVHSIVVSQDRYHLAFAAQFAMLTAAGVAHLSRPESRVRRAIGRGRSAAATSA